LTTEGCNVDDVQAAYRAETTGEEPSEVGARLPYFPLGVGRTVVDLSCSVEAMCALLDNDEAKCFGNAAFVGNDSAGSGSAILASNAPSAVDLNLAVGETPTKFVSRASGCRQCLDKMAPSSSESRRAAPKSAMRWRVGQRIASAEIPSGMPVKSLSCRTGFTVLTRTRASAWLDARATLLTHSLSLCRGTPLFRSTPTGRF